MVLKFKWQVCGWILPVPGWQYHVRHPEVTPPVLLSQKLITLGRNPERLFGQRFSNWRCSKHTTRHICATGAGGGPMWGIKLTHGCCRKYSVRQPHPSQVWLAQVLVEEDGRGGTGWAERGWANGQASWGTGGVCIWPLGWTLTPYPQSEWALQWFHFHRSKQEAVCGLPLVKGKYPLIWGELQLLSNLCRL